MKLKKTCCLLLACVMLLGLLSACGGEGGPASNTPAPEYGYVAKYTELDGEFEGVSNATLSGDRIYFTSNVQDGEITESYPAYDENGNPVLDENGEPVMEEYTYPNYVTAVFSMDLTGGDVRRVPGFSPTVIPEGAQGGSWINNFKVSPDGKLIFIENIYYSIESGSGDTTDTDGTTDAGAASGHRPRGGGDSRRCARCGPGVQL